jgi:pimeloyl-ACP methyl ester carboxylesterase
MIHRRIPEPRDYLARSIVCREIQGMVKSSIVSFIDGFMASRGVHRATSVGHSLGGAIALTGAVRSLSFVEAKWLASE